MASPTFSCKLCNEYPQAFHPATVKPGERSFIPIISSMFAAEQLSLLWGKWLLLSYKENYGYISSCSNICTDPYFPLGPKCVFVVKLNDIRVFSSWWLVIFCLQYGELSFEKLKLKVVERSLRLLCQLPPWRLLASFQTYCQGTLALYSLVLLLFKLAYFIGSEWLSLKTIILHILPKVKLRRQKVSNLDCV